MRMSIRTLLPQFKGQAFMPYNLDGINTIGVWGNEPFMIKLHNDKPYRVGFRLMLDGRSLQTGRPATLNPEDGETYFMMDAYSYGELVAWAESRTGGAQLIFTHAGDSVAMHTPGDLAALGYISLAVFESGYTPPPSTYQTKGGLESLGGGSYSYGGGMRGSTRGGGEVTRGGDGGNTRGVGPGVGAGDFKRQQLRSTEGLIRPVYKDELHQVRYWWWNDLVARLQDDGMPFNNQTQNRSQHPTGFSTFGADLGTTPRLGRQMPETPVEVPGYLRLYRPDW